VLGVVAEQEHVAVRDPLDARTARPEAPSGKRNMTISPRWTVRLALWSSAFTTIQSPSAISAPSTC
jgi:hypothetical protein